MTIKILGECFGVHLVPRGEDDSHITMRFLIEDDEQWFFSGFQLSSSWLDDVIDVLQRTKAALATQTPVIHHQTQYGYKFKNKRTEKQNIPPDIIDHS